MLDEFKPGHNATQATKNICYAKDEGAFNHSTSFEKIPLGLQESQKSNVGLKRWILRSLSKILKVNPASSTRRVWSEFSVVGHFQDLY